MFQYATYLEELAQYVHWRELAPAKAALVSCSPHPLRASSRVCFKQKPQQSWGALMKCCGEGGETVN